MADHDTLIGFVSGDGDRPAPQADTIASRYAILGVLGQGASGVVYKVHDLELDEIVALKRLRTGLGAAAVARFRREVRLARRVTHPNVVRIHDLGEADGAPYLTMEWVDGRSLRHYLEDGGVPPDMLPTWCAQLFAGVAAAHAAGVVHCDLKPDNVLVSATGRVAVADFGIAHVTASLPGVFAGTPAYMAPEQARGAASPQSDQYALAAMLFELIAGVPPWPNATPAEVAARRHLPVPNLQTACGAIPAHLVEAVTRALSPEPGDRFPSLLAFQAALDPRDVEPVQAPRPSLRPRAASVAVVVGPIVASAVGASDEVTRWCEPVGEALSECLAGSVDLRVRPRTAWQASRGADALARAASIGATALASGELSADGEGWALLLRLETLPGGYQVWSGRFRGADVLEVVSRAAAGVASALAARLPEVALPRQPAAIERYLSVRQRLRRAWLGEADAALAAAQAAAAEFPDEPMLLALYAEVAADEAMRTDRRDVLDAGRQAATQALALAPDLGEAWYAVARMSWIDGRYSEVVAALRTTLTRAPGHGRAHEMLGALLLEIGEIREALDHLAAAREIDPTSMTLVGEWVRAHALLGDWDAVDAALADTRSVPADAQRIVLIARLYGWRGRAGPPVVLMPESVVLTPASQFVALIQEFQAGGWPDAQMLALGELASSVQTSTRLRMALLQIDIESRCWMRPDTAFERLRALVAMPFIDKNWMLYCPVLATLREHSEFPALLSTVIERSGALHPAGHVATR
jgi:tetratricopeptide (TPR) repeat protein